MYSPEVLISELSHGVHIWEKWLPAEFQPNKKSSLCLGFYKGEMNLISVAIKILICYSKRKANIHSNIVANRTKTKGMFTMRRSVIGVLRRREGFQQKKAK